ncbi:unnamed protein product, partial [Chrysoparadoxa australica]
MSSLTGGLIPLGSKAPARAEQNLGAGSDSDWDADDNLGPGTFQTEAPASAAGARKESKKKRRTRTKGKPKDSGMVYGGEQELSLSFDQPRPDLGLDEPEEGGLDDDSYLFRGATSAAKAKAQSA